MWEEEPNMDEVAQVMHDLRVAAGSRGKLADALGVSDSTAQGWERFGRLPEAVNLARIIRAFPALGERLVEAIAPGYEGAAWDGTERRTGEPTEPPDGGVPGRFPARLTGRQAQSQRQDRRAQGGSG